MKKYFKALGIVLAIICMIFVGKVIVDYTVLGSIADSIYNEMYDEFEEQVYVETHYIVDCNRESYQTLFDEDISECDVIATFYNTDDEYLVSYALNVDSL